MIQGDEAQKLLREYAERMASDPLRKWRPHSKQREFFDLVMNGPYDEYWALWANRAGKTVVGGAIGSTLARFGLPRSEVKPAIGASGTVVWDNATSGWVCGVTSNVVRDVLAPTYFNNGFAVPGRMEPFIPEREILEWRITDRVLKLKNGSIIGFKAYSDGAATFPGVSKDWIHLDEPPPRDVYVEATMRIGAGRRLRTFATCTLLPPEGNSAEMSWVFTERVRPWQTGKNINWGISTASTYDNSFISPDEISKLLGKYPTGSVDARIRIDGELLPGVGGTRAYGSFNPAVHVRGDALLRDRLPLCLCLDFNVAPMVCVIGQRHGRVFVATDEIVLERGSVPEIAQAFLSKYPVHGAEIWVYGDSTGHNVDVQTGRTDYQILLNHLRKHPSPISLKVPHAQPRVLPRVNAVNRALIDERGFVGVSIHPRCEDLILDLNDVLRDPKGGILKTYDMKNPYQKRTHTSDAFGAWVVFEQPVSTTALSSDDGSGRYSAPAGRTRMRLPSY